MANPLTTPAARLAKLQEKIGTYAALTTAIVAALAAISSLMAARYSGRATSELVRASNAWNYYQAKSLKSYILISEKEILSALGKHQNPEDTVKLEALEQEKREIKAKAEANTANSEVNATLSHLLADAVTLFQIAIANAALAALVKRIGFWLVSLGLAAGGVGFFVYFLLRR